MRLAEAAKFTEEMIRLTERTVRQLDYRSRINMISKGFSSVEGALIGKPANAESVEIVGFADLNGDLLPDYVITDDRERRCGPGSWTVYWGTGSARFSENRAFTPEHSCFLVPPTPPELVARGYSTIPLQADLSRRGPATFTVPFVAPVQLDTVENSYVSLTDFNQDGRPDLLVASKFDVASNQYKEPWDPDAGARTWSIFLNNGKSFDIVPLEVQSPIGAPTRVEGAWTGRTDATCAPWRATNLNVAYPSVRSTHTVTSVTNRSLDRDAVCLHAGFVELDGDGSVDIARRVRCTGSVDCPAGNAGLLVWSRGGSGPQDVLISERYPIEGSQVIVEYKPASWYQWPDGTPTGQPPVDGHRLAAGGGSVLVRSVTVERLMGRSEQRSRSGYDYRLPAFDDKTRLPFAFALRTSSPLDPATGAPISASLMTQQRDAQRPNGVGALTHIRTVVRGSGAPVHETLTSYTEDAALGVGAGGLTATFSAPTDSFEGEYPEGLTRDRSSMSPWMARSPSGIGPVTARSCLLALGVGLPLIQPNRPVGRRHFPPP